MVMSVVSPRKKLLSLSSFGGIGRKRRCRYEEDDEGEGLVELVQLGAEKTKNVLILMSDTGGGHRASAEAIRDAFQLQFGDQYRVHILHP